MKGILEEIRKYGRRSLDNGKRIAKAVESGKKIIISPEHIDFLKKYAVMSVDNRKEYQIPAKIVEKEDALHIILSADKHGVIEGTEEKIPLEQRYELMKKVIEGLGEGEVYLPIHTHPLYVHASSHGDVNLVNDYLQFSGLVTTTPEKEGVHFSFMMPDSIYPKREPVEVTKPKPQNHLEAIKVIEKDIDEGDDFSCNRAFDYLHNLMKNNTAKELFANCDGELANRFENLKQKVANAEFKPFFLTTRDARSCFNEWLDDGNVRFEEIRLRKRAREAISEVSRKLEQEGDSVGQDLDTVLDCLEDPELMGLFKGAAVPELRQLKGKLIEFGKSDKAVNDKILSAKIKSCLDKLSFFDG